MAFRGDISALILGALQASPRHGYELVRSLRESGAVGKLAEGQIYPYMHRLEREGLVHAEWDTETGGAARRVYSLTEKGVLELDGQKKAWLKFSKGVGQLLNLPERLEEKHA